MALVLLFFISELKPISAQTTSEKGLKGQISDRLRLDFTTFINNQKRSSKAFSLFNIINVFLIKSEKMLILIELIFVLTCLGISNPFIHVN